MINTLFWVFVGALIGWHFPQPEWVKKIVNKTKDTVEEVTQNPWDVK